MKTNTLILIKPDALKRGLTLEILNRFTRKGFQDCRRPDSNS